MAEPLYTVIDARGKQVGPIPASELRQWIHTGRLDETALCKVEGSVRWTPLRKIPDLYAVEGGAPAAVAPVKKQNGRRRILLLAAAGYVIFLCVSLGLYLRHEAEKERVHELLKARAPANPPALATVASPFNEDQVRELKQPLANCLRLLVAGMNGEIPDTEAALARALIFHAAERHSKTAAVFAGQGTYEGSGIDRGDLIRAAEGGNPNAELRLGIAYLYAGSPGFADSSLAGVQRDPVVASDWLMKAANHGSLRAEWVLAMAFRDGALPGERFANHAYWMFEIAENVTASAYQVALFERALEMDLSHASVDSLHQLEAAQKALSPDERTAADALSNLDLMKRKRAMFNERPLTDEEAGVAKRLLDLAGPGP